MRVQTREGALITLVLSTILAVIIWQLIAFFGGVFIQNVYHYDTGYGICKENDPQFYQLKAGQQIEVISDPQRIESEMFQMGLSFRSSGNEIIGEPIILSLKDVGGQELAYITLWEEHLRPENPLSEQLPSRTKSYWQAYVESNGSSNEHLATFMLLQANKHMLKIGKGDAIRITQSERSKFTFFINCMSNNVVVNGRQQFTYAYRPDNRPIQ